MISGGQRNDITYAIPVLEQIKEIGGSQILADREYDSQELIAYIYDRGGEPTIPSRKGAKYECKCDWWLYKECHLLEMDSCQKGYYYSLSLQIGYWNFIALSSLKAVPFF